VRAAFRRPTIERALQLATVVLVVSTLLAAGSIIDWMPVARRLRWVALLGLVAVALVYAARRSARLPVAPLVLAAAFSGLTVASVGWSATQRLTLGRSVAFGLVLLAAAAMALGAAGRPEAVERLLTGVLAAAVVVALGGLLVLAFRYDRAVQAATTVSPARYQGLGGGPNMAPMIFAVASPLAAQLAVFGARRGRWLGAGALALLSGSIAFSGSRGAITAAFVGLAVFALAAPARRRLLLAATAALLGVTLLAVQIRSPSATNPPQPTGVDPAPAEVTPRPGYVDANKLGPRLQDEVGHPGIGVADTRRRVRGLLGSSGRTEAWDGALDQAFERPLLGHAFGTEDRVFVDRYVFFNSGVPENSYIGLLLQLGVVGLVLFVLVAVALLVRTFRVRAGAVAAAAAAAFSAGLVLAFFQSYVYAAGNNATAAVWICGFLALAATVPRAAPR
jgi:O-antigen ligase